MKSFIRRKKIECGKNYLDIEIYPYTQGQDQGTVKKRAKKEKLSSPKQKDLNDKNARKTLGRIMKANFNSDDLHVSLTYDNKHLPKTLEEAERKVRNFLRRLAYHRKKKGLPELKYILITSYRLGSGGNEPVRIHHHLLINGGMGRDEVESLWRCPRRKGEKQGERIGYANADRLQLNGSGLEGLCQYLSKQANGKKRWSSSQNLDKPSCWTNDHEYSRRKVEQMAKSPPDPEYWEKKYPGFILSGWKTEYNEITGWAISVRLWKPPKTERR